MNRGECLAVLARGLGGLTFAALWTARWRQVATNLPQASPLGEKCPSKTPCARREKETAA